MNKLTNKHYLILTIILTIFVAGVTGYINFFPANPELESLKLLYKRDTEVKYPLKNPYSKAKYELGKKLFFDPRLSDSDVISCATCHNPGFSFTDALPNAKGKGHQFVARRTMSLYNVAWDEVFLWDGKAASLEEQVEEALTAPMGMSMDISEVVEKIYSIAGYRKLFQEAFAQERPEYAENDYVNMKSIAAALATFERNIISGEAPFDEWIEGNEAAISEDAKRGFVLFNGKAKCADCHTGWRFSDGKYYNIGVKEKDSVIDLGKGSTNSADPEIRFTFKAVGLRNIDQRAPYMHNGSIETLHEVIEFYNKGGDLRHDNTKTEPLNLTEQEKQDLVEFLKTLTDDDPKITVPRLPR